MLFLRSFVWGNQFILGDERAALYHFSEDTLLCDPQLEIRESACELCESLEPLLELIICQCSPIKLYETESFAEALNI